MNRTAFPCKQSSPGTQEICFVFNTNNTSNPLTASFDGAKSFIASVVRNAAGKFTVTFTDAVQKVLWVSPELDDTANDGAYATVGNISNEASATPLSMVLYTRAGATTTATDYAARRVMLRVCVRNSTVAG